MYTEKEILEFLNLFPGTNKDLKHLKDVKVMENHSTEEELKEKISWLKSELNLKSLELSDKERYYTDKLEKLEQKVENLKEDRKHLLQDKNAVINLTKGLIDDRIGHTVYETNYLITKYFEELNNLNLGSNDSNTKVYMKMKKERDYYKSIADDHVKNVDYTTERIVNLKEENKECKDKIEYRNEIIKQIQKQNQDLVNEINTLKEENGDLKEKVDTLKIDNEYLIGKMRRARTELCFNKKGE